MKLITTSWDDGYIGDMRIAELLDKYNLQGTFYIPATNDEHKVMSENDIVALSKKFEIGGHTMNHTTINKVSNELFSTEILGCYEWLTNLTGKQPVSFCFPRGVYNRAAIDYTFNSGFKIIRSTELLNPSLNEDSLLTPTTLQVYPHSTFTYYKHLIKRIKLKSLILYSRSHSTSNVQKLVDYYLNYIHLNGGCFHLWGHSWEIEENNLWSSLENILKALSNISEFDYKSNGDLLPFKDELN
jgi:peptidoglycan/xylan/chitin deacetylase (PgdA/CDA1 family)